MKKAKGFSRFTDAYQDIERSMGTVLKTDGEDLMKALEILDLIKGKKSRRNCSC